MSVSVCMATYNGERFIVPQLKSILAQLTVNDEVIVVDDCSTDGTVKAIEGLGDRRISVQVNDRNRGEVYSFGRAMLAATNDFLLLSDQDDVWIAGRAALMRDRLVESGASVVCSNFSWMNDRGEPIDVEYDGVRCVDSKRYLRNTIDIFLGKTNYFGCAMGLRRDFVNVVAPIPSFVESHDLWIALAGNLFGANIHLDEETLRKRQHANNATSTVSARSVYLKLRARMIFVMSLVVLLIRAREESTRP